MFFGALFISMAMAVAAIDETCENGLCSQEDAPALSLLQFKAQKVTAIEYTDVGSGMCLYQPPRPPTPTLPPPPKPKAVKVPKFAYKGQEGRKCQALCDADKECGGYSNDNVNNCLLWLMPTLVGGGGPWGDCDCHVKDGTGYKNLGPGKCLYQPPTPPTPTLAPPPMPKVEKVPKFAYKGGQGRDCRELCNADKECGGYTNDDVNNCILWLSSGLVGGGGQWGNGHCYVKK